MLNKYLNYAILIHAVFLLGGCASTKGGLITSLEDITTESDKEGLSEIPQHRVISVNGMLPFTEPGSLQFYKANRKPSTAVGLSKDRSFVMESVIKSDCDVTCLITIRNNMLLLKGNAAALVEARINLAKLNSSPLSKDSTEDVIKKYSEALSKSEAAYSTIRNELDQNYKTVLESINKTGIMIYRWNSNSKKNGTLGLGEIISTSGSKDETYSGFAIVSGLRTATLYLGNDLINAWAGLNTKSKYSNQFELTTHVMQAQHIVYITDYDLQSMVNAKLKASYEQLAKMPETIKNLDQIEINAALSKVANLSNMGVIGDSKRAIRYVDWENHIGIDELCELDGWQTFYSVESDLTDLMEMLTTSKVEPKNSIGSTK